MKDLFDKYKNEIEQGVFIFAIFVIVMLVLQTIFFLFGY
jgi:hypothetical protein